MNKNKICVSSTNDNSDDLINALIDDLGRDNFCKEKHHILNASIGYSAAAIIQIIGDLSTWETLFKVSATIAFSTFAKNFSEDLYNSCKRVAKAIIKNTRGTKNKHSVKVVITSHNNIELSLFLPQESEEELAFKISCFYAASNQLFEHFTKLLERYERRIMPPKISISQEGDIKASCYAGINNDYIELTVSLATKQVSCEIKKTNLSA